MTLDADLLERITNRGPARNNLAPPVPWWSPAAVESRCLGHLQVRMSTFVLRHMKRGGRLFL
jgi:hypothetical protein